MQTSLRDRKIEFDGGGIIFSMALNRLLQPKGELATHKWARGVYGIKAADD